MSQKFKKISGLSSREKRRRLATILEEQYFSNGETESSHGHESDKPSVHGDRSGSSDSDNENADIHVQQNSAYLQKRH